MCPLHCSFYNEVDPMSPALVSMIVGFALAFVAIMLPARCKSCGKLVWPWQRANSPMLAEDFFRKLHRECDPP